VKSFLSFLVIVLSASTFARDIKVSCPLIPPLVESKDKGLIISLLKAMDEEYTEGNLLIEVYPFARSVENVKTGDADIQIPIAVNPIVDKSTLPFSYSDEIVFNNLFGLYTNKNNSEINKDNLDKYKVETDLTFEKFFKFKVEGSAKIEQSLKKLDINRIDAFIMGMPAADAELKKLQLKNVRRQLYSPIEMKFIVQKNESGKALNARFSEILKKLKSNGKYKEAMGKLANLKYEEWQTY